MFFTTRCTTKKAVKKLAILIITRIVTVTLQGMKVATTFVITYSNGNHKKKNGTSRNPNPKPLKP